MNKQDQKNELLTENQREFLSESAQERLILLKQGEQIGILEQELKQNNA